MANLVRTGMGGGVGQGVGGGQFQGFTGVGVKPKAPKPALGTVYGGGQPSNINMMQKMTQQYKAPSIGKNLSQVQVPVMPQSTPSAVPTPKATTQANPGVDMNILGGLYNLNNGKYTFGGNIQKSAEVPSTTATNPQLSNTTAFNPANTQQQPSYGLPVQNSAWDVNTAPNQGNTGGFTKNPDGSLTMRDPNNPFGAMVTVDAATVAAMGDDYFNQMSMSPQQKLSTLYGMNNMQDRANYLSLAGNAYLQGTTQGQQALGGPDQWRSNFNLANYNRIR